MQSEIAMLLSKKSILKLGTQMNDNAGSKPSSFALKQMEKMGWTEGKGLGKTESGISKHITVTKRDDSAGLGTEAVKTQAMEASETWWHDAFASNLKAMKTKHEKKSKSSKSDKGSKKRKSDEVEVSDCLPSYDELFKATGGARLGMRARADQKGKLKRTEGLDVESKIESVSISAPISNIAQVATVTESASSDGTAGEEDGGKEKKSKKEKKQKKEKKDKEETVDNAEDSKKSSKKSKKSKD